MRHTLKSYKSIQCISYTYRLLIITLLTLFSETRVFNAITHPYLKQKLQKLKVFFLETGIIEKRCLIFCKLKFHQKIYRLRCLHVKVHLSVICGYEIITKTILGSDGRPQ